MMIYHSYMAKNVDSDVSTNTTTREIETNDMNLKKSLKNIFSFFSFLQGSNLYQQGNLVFCMH